MRCCICDKVSQNNGVILYKTPHADREEPLCRECVSAIKRAASLKEDDVEAYDDDDLALLLLEQEFIDLDILYEKLIRLASKPSPSEGVYVSDLVGPTHPTDPPQEAHQRPPEGLLEGTQTGGVGDGQV